MAAPATTQLSIGDINLAATLRSTAILPGDPTVRLEPGRFVRATITPAGTGEIRVVWADGVADVEAWGDGAAWLIDRAPRLLGLEDDVSGFDPDGP
ncbi:MAG: DNA-3-methyladenine glycosylase 2 family protein, partial [Actinomycetota bacterium]